MQETTQKRSRVLFILPSLGQGGAETQLVSLVNGLSSKRFIKHLLCFESQHELLEQVNQDDVVFEYIPRRRKTDRNLSAEISEYIKQHQIDVVHATLFISGYFAWNAIQLSGTKCPLVVAIHSTMIRSWQFALAWRTLFQASLRGAAKLTFVSDNQRASWLDRFSWMEKNSVTIHNGVQSDRFVKEHHESAGLELRKRLNINATVPVISCIAAFRPEKNHKVLVQAIKKLKLDVILCLAGDGDGRTEVEQLVEQLGLQDKIQFLGRVTDVRPLLAISSFTVMASKREAFSMAMLESLAMKIPMLATDVGGMSEAIVPFETGLLVIPSDADALTAGITEMLNDPARLARMGENGAALVRGKFTREVMIEKTGQLLIDVATSH